MKTFLFKVEAQNEGSGLDKDDTIVPKVGDELDGMGLANQEGSSDTGQSSIQRIVHHINQQTFQKLIAVINSKNVLFCEFVMSGWICNREGARRRRFWIGLTRKAHRRKR